ncbi:hypothetical protein [Halosegnis sp.]|uniref:hypothetical protein n=1 Tax=Halosegnis sp. TaxID=2864959 RepID=UPI0035D5291D
MEIGCFVAHEQSPPGRLLEHAAAAERAGFDHVEVLSTSPDQRRFIDPMAAVTAATE